MNTCLFSQQKLTSFTEKKGVIEYEFPQHPCPHSIMHYKLDPPLTTHNLTKAKMLSQCLFTAKRVTFIKFPQTSVKTPKDNHQFIQLLFKNNNKKLSPERCYFRDEVENHSEENQKASILITGQVEVVLLLTDSS